MPGSHPNVSLSGITSLFSPVFQHSPRLPDSHRQHRRPGFRPAPPCLGTGCFLAVNGFNKSVPLQQFYTGTLAGAPADQLAGAAQQLSAQMPKNYSPTTFLVQSIVDEPLRSVDYVTTLVFVNAAGYQKARALSSNPVP